MGCDDTERKTANIHFNFILCFRGWDFGFAAPADPGEAVCVGYAVGAITPPVFLTDVG